MNGDTPDTERAMSTEHPKFDDFLPLSRLYTRFDQIASGREPGSSPDTHRAILDRLASNRRDAEALGWTACELDRVGGSGRLVMTGIAPAGVRRELVPDSLSEPRTEIAAEA